MDRGTEALKRKSDEMMTQASDALRMGREAVQTGTDRLRTEARRLDAAYQAGKEAYHQHPAEA
jgi:hypothetical protein